jgi:2-(3-amino-3-carboxypropyl)histidine synthase
MKTIFIPAKNNLKLEDSDISALLKKLPKKIALAYSIQYKETAEKFKKILSKTHKIIGPVQVLGCSKPKFATNVDAILLIGSGKFHATSLAIETNFQVFILENNHLIEISSEEIKKFQEKKKVSYINFLNSDKVGILVSTKPGQENLKNALKLKKKLTDKKSYLFLSNNLDIREFENFGLKSWVNTACPRLDMNSNKVINASELNLCNTKKCF